VFFCLIRNQCLRTTVPEFLWCSFRCSCQLIATRCCSVQTGIVGKQTAKGVKFVFKGSFLTLPGPKSNDKTESAEEHGSLLRTNRGYALSKINKSIGDNTMG
jgi:hypothetical protein